MFDPGEVRAAIAAHGPVARVVIAGHDGSSPREAGAAMLVWDGGQSGTIGGGALEFQAVARARDMLAAGGVAVQRVALGPNIGQCCGGAVTLVCEVYDAAKLPDPKAGLVARALDGSEAPLSVARMIDRARAQGSRPGTALLQGWLVEPLARPERALWIWGAGHVGRALVSVLAPLPDLAINWVDVAPERFPETVPAGVRVLPAPDMAAAVALAPSDAEHLVLTFSHALDLELCHRLLPHGFAACGLIGSATKWARFRSRLHALGHSPELIATILCPIGNPALGKHPQAIAISVAAEILGRSAARARTARTLKEHIG
ncbi:xanthine dehydrogenase accessory protein XdhC [Paracoccaceae bacterium]